MPLKRSEGETGFTLTSYKFRGVVTFVSDEWGTEYMHLFTANGYQGRLKECEEGELVWITKEQIEELKLWEGDKIFLRLLQEEGGFFSLKLKYRGEELIVWIIFVLTYYIIYIKDKC